ncbi:hypothetical protein ACJJTC_000291 [Scirpophaga incertulas]
MDTLLKSDNKSRALKQLSNSCPTLDRSSYFPFTKDRIKLVVPSLEKNIVHVIHDVERDETLFGNSLGEKIKACKAIGKTGPSCPAGKLDRTSSLPVNQGGAGGQQRPASQGKSPQLPFDIVANSAEEFQPTPRLVPTYNISAVISTNDKFANYVVNSTN